MTSQPYGPWGLTPAEVRAMDATCVYERHKVTARRLGITVRTIEAHMRSAYKKMGVAQLDGSTRVHAMRVWLEYHGAIRL